MLVAGRRGGEPGSGTIPAGAGAAGASGVLEFGVGVFFEVGLPVFGHRFGLAEEIPPAVEGEEVVGVDAGAVGLGAGPGPVDGAAGESGLDGVVFEVAEEGLEAGGVEEIGVVAGVQLVGPWRW